MGAEIHAISSGVKPLTSWTTRDAIQECREACGGHGYLKGNLEVSSVKVWLYYRQANFFLFCNLEKLCVN